MIRNARRGLTVLRVVKKAVAPRFSAFRTTRTKRAGPPPLILRANHQPQRESTRKKRLTWSSRSTRRVRHRIVARG